MNRAKILSKKPIFSAKLFTVNEMEVEVKPGIKRVHHNVERNSVVYVFPLGDNGEIYLTKQYRYNLNRDMLEVVAGYVEKGEEPLAAAKRELKEELGLTALKLTEISQVELGGGVFKGQVYMYLAQGLAKGETELDEGEDIEPVVMPFTEVLEKVLNQDKDINIVICMYGILLIDKLRSEGKLQ